MVEVLLYIQIQCLLLVILLCVYVYLQYKIRKQQKAVKGRAGVGGFKTYPILGTLPEFLKNRHRFLEWSTEALRTCPTKTAVFWRPGKAQGVITANPDNVEHVLKSNFQNYPKGERFRLLLTDFLGQGIFNSDGDLWKLQRKTASYEFSTKSLGSFVLENVAVELHSRLLPALRSAAATGRVVDLQDLLERFAFDNVCKLAFNVDPACLDLDLDSTSQGADFMRAFEDAATLSSGRFMYAFPALWRIKKFLGVGSERRLQRAIHTVHQFADNIIRSRRATTLQQQQQDLLSRFVANEDNNSPEFLRDIIISFILAGRDTTSSALSWFFWLLSSRPRVQLRILQELHAIGIQNKNNNYYNLRQLRDMQYLQAAISEAMRLYPPVPVDTRACLREDVLPDGTLVGKDWFVSYHTYAMGRMESIWGEDCLEYVPERWLDEEGMCRHESPFRFPVFHAGPRMCLGKDMAFIQMKSIAASVIHGFHVQVLHNSSPPQHLLSLTLRMTHGLPVKLTPRLLHPTPPLS